MIAAGMFDVDLKPQADKRFAAGRMTINKVYKGDLVGTGKGQMISKRIDGGAAVYYAIEEFKGTIGEKEGAFTLVHQGHMDADGQTLSVEILNGSGTKQLKTISGSMTINRNDSGHSYELTYTL